MKSTPFSPVAFSFELPHQANGSIQLFPFGRFSAQDGREGSWYVDDSNGYLLAEEINRLEIDLMIDYEHQTLYVAQNGAGNPAAGWIVRAEYRSGEGLFADVKWTERAKTDIEQQIYRYISPLFLANPEGKVVKVLNAALTNRPALHNLQEAMAMSAQFSHFLTTEEHFPMKEKLIALFGLSAQATDEQIIEKLNALSAAKGDSSVALIDVYGALATAQAEKVALSAKVDTPDPAKYVALSDLQLVQTELNQLKQQINDKARDDLIQTALSDGRLLPAQKAWAESLGKTNLTALSDYLATVSPNPALQGTQSGGQDPTQAAKTVALTAGEMAGAKALGLSPQEYIERYKQEQK